jgi:hypothetical protein
MNPKMYEGLAAQHLAELHREAAGGQLVARARGDREFGGASTRLRVQPGRDGLAAMVAALRLRLRATERPTSA